MNDKGVKLTWSKKKNKQTKKKKREGAFPISYRNVLCLAMISKIQTTKINEEIYYVLEWRRQF